MESISLRTHSRLGQVAPPKGCECKGDFSTTDRLSVYSFSRRLSHASILSPPWHLELAVHVEPAPADQSAWDNFGRDRRGTGSDKRPDEALPADRQGHQKRACPQGDY